MAVTFPDSPVLNQSHQAENGLTYIWDGEKWSSQSAYNISEDNYIKKDGSNTVAYADQLGMGIGTNTPGTLLHLSSTDPRITLTDTDAGGNIQLRNTNGAGYLGTIGDSPFIFLTDGTERVRINSNGNFGIGTNNPGYILDVEGGPSSTQFTSTANWNFSNVYIRRKASNVPLAKMISMLLDGDSASDTDFTNNLSIWGTYDSTPTTGSTSDGLNAGMNLGAPGGILFHTNGSERARILGSGGITFNGDTAQANALDDYEEGSWSPVLTADAPGTGVWAPDPGTGGNGGFYTKVGKKVFFQFNLRGTWTKGTAAGAMNISGLPYLVAGIGDRPGASAYGSVQMPYIEGISAAAGYVVSGGLCLPGTDKIHVYMRNNSLTFNLGIEVASTANAGMNIHGSGSYEIA